MRGKRFRSRVSCCNPRISPLTQQYKCPHLSLLTLSSGRLHQQKKQTTKVPFCYSVLNHADGRSAPAWNTLICSQERARAEKKRVRPARGNGPPAIPLRRSRAGVQERLLVDVKRPPCTPFRAHTRAGVAVEGALVHLTTSFLSAAKLIYAIGAGVTAAAGTRLSLQSLLDVCFTHSLIPVRRPKPATVIFGRYLGESPLGKLRPCCLPWIWPPSLRRPLRSQTLIPRARRRLVSPIH